MASSARQSRRASSSILMITAFIDMVGLLMVIPLLPFYAKTLGARRADRRACSIALVRRGAAAQRADVGAVLRPVRPAAGAARRARRVGDRVRDLRLRATRCWLLLPLAHRAGRGRRHGRRDPGLRRRRHARPRSARRRSAGSRRRRTPASRIGPVLGSLAARAWARRGPGLVAAALCVREHALRVALPHRVARHDGSRGGEGRRRAARAHARRDRAGRDATRRSRRRG